MNTPKRIWLVWGERDTRTPGEIKELCRELNVCPRCEGTGELVADHDERNYYREPGHVSLAFKRAVGPCFLCKGSGKYANSIIRGRETKNGRARLSQKIRR